MVDEIKVGNLVFQYDGSREMFVGNEDEIGGMVEHVWPEDWASFVAAVSDGHSKASESTDTYGFTMVDAFQDEWLSFWMGAYGSKTEEVEA